MRDRIMGGKRRLTVVTADHFVEFANPIDRWCSPLKNRTRLSEIGQTHDGYEECDGRGHRACEAWAA